MDEKIDSLHEEAGELRGEGPQGYLTIKLGVTSHPYWMKNGFCYGG